MLSGHAFENKISSYELEVMTRTFTKIFGGVLVHAPNVAYVRPWSKKTQTFTKEDSYLHHSIFLNELIILAWSNVKIRWKMTESWTFKICAKVASWPIWASNWSFWPHFLRYGLQIWFARHLFAHQSKSESDPNEPFYSIKFKTSKNVQKRLYLSSCIFERLTTPNMKEIPKIIMDFWVRHPKLFGQFVAKICGVKSI